MILPTASRHLLLVTCFFAVLAGAQATPIPADELNAHVFSLARNYFAEFQHPDTGILYGARLSGKKTWTSPEDVKHEKPMPWGYGSRIADTSLHTGHMLVAMLDAHDARPDPFLRDQIRTLFEAMKRIGSLPEKYPKLGKPALRGLVPRGPHPDDRSAYYDDSSMDQHTTYIISLAIYANSPLATDADKNWIGDSLQKVGRRLEKNNWSILRADGVTQAHVGFSWKGFNSSHASILLPAVLALYHGTGDAHWLETYETFMKEKDGERWKQVHPGPHVRINGHPIYANQNAFRVNAWHHFEADADRKSVLQGLLEQSVTLQMNRDFPGDFYRKYNSDDRWERARREFGWNDDELRGAAVAWNGFKPSMLDHDDAGLAALAHVRFPLGGFHMVLLSENESLIREHLPAIWKMLRTVDLEKIDAGETRYLFTVVGLHLYAQLHRHPERFTAPSSPSAPETAGKYGRELAIAHNAGTGPVIDVAVAGDRAYAIGKTALHILDVTDPAHPRALGKLNGLGNVRQIVVENTIAYITSREDGLFIVDVTDPAGPRLLDHYDTVEFATGVALSGDVLFVACRNFGVELIDVSDPEKPVHLSTVRTGEAQSVIARNGILYAGVWATSEIVVVDVKNPRAPAIVDRVPLDGYGDGVDVAGDHLFAATGHHSKTVAYRNPDDPGFGRGHGLEIFDIRDPLHPVFVSRVKFPRFYEIGNDTWGVTVVNGHALVADTYNGMFVVDVRDPRQPAITARLQLPRLESKNMPGFIGGLAPVVDHVYVAGGYTDLHVVALPGIADVPAAEPDRAPVIGPATESEAPHPRWRSYDAGGQVYAVDLLEDGRVVAACGSAGVHLLKCWPDFERIAVLETEGFATDVCVSGVHVFVAEGFGGLSVYELSADRPHLTRIGRYRVKGRPVRRVEVPSPGKNALVQAGSNRFLILDITDPASPKKVLEDARPGLLYGEQMMPQLVENRYACVFWHVSGLHWYDMGRGALATPAFSGDHYEQRIGSKNGLAVFRDKTLATVRGGFVLLDRSERRPLAELPLHRIGEKSRHLGTPFVHANRLYAADRSTGLVTVADLTDPEKPKLLEQFTTPGNPGRPIVRNGALIIPDGYHGLLVLDR